MYVSLELSEFQSKLISSIWIKKDMDLAQRWKRFSIFNEVETGHSDVANAGSGENQSDVWKIKRVRIDLQPFKTSITT